MRTARSPRNTADTVAGAELEVDAVVLNTSQPLFASARMRRAAHYAVDPRSQPPADPRDLAVTGGEGGNDPADRLDYLTKRDSTNVSPFPDPRIDALLAAAARHSGLARAFAYARVDRILVRVAAPWIAYANESEHDFFSARIGCQLYAPIAGMDLGSLCIRPSGPRHSSRGARSTT